MSKRPRNIRQNRINRTQSDSQSGKRWALLIGINDYDDPEINNLRYCVEDVKAFHDALIEPEIGGFHQQNVWLMVDSRSGLNEPTDLNIIKRLDQIEKQIEPEDTFVFYFAGHGMTHNERHFLLSINADPYSIDTLVKSAISLQRVKNICNRIQAHQKLIILDACRNEPESSRGEQDNLLTEDFARNIQIRPQRSQSELPSITATLYSCDVGERAWEWKEKNHGVFSYYLLEGLRGEAVTGNGDVTVDSLASYTNHMVKDWAETYKNQKQTPWIDREAEGGAKLILTSEKYRIRFWLNQAQQKLAQDEDERALELFQQVLEIEPHNADAIAGIEEIERRQQIIGTRVEPYAVINVESEPSGATVYVDGKNSGTTPTEISVNTGVRREKTVELGLELEGYLPYLEDLSLHAGQRGTCHRELKPDSEFQAEQERQAKIQALLDDAKEEFDAGNYEKAIDIYRQVLEIDSENAVAKSGIEEAQRRLEEKQTEEERKRQEQQRKAEIRDLFKEAESKRKANDFSGAIKIWEKVLELDPENALAKSRIADAKKIAKKILRIRVVKGSIALILITVIPLSFFIHEFFRLSILMSLEKSFLSEKKSY